VLSADSWQATSALSLAGNERANAIFGNAGANVLNGGGGVDQLFGNGGNDVLIGGAGGDYVAGGLGDDTYIIEDASDMIGEASGEGTDIAYAGVSYTLSAGAEVEILSAISWQGTDPLSLTGNERANEIFGNAGANVLNGDGGADLLHGFGGNDVYIVDNAGDVVDERAGEGNDIVFASVSFALTAGSEVEVLSADSWQATSALSLAGNERANEIFGNAGANVLNGGGGADLLHGLDGADTFAFTTALGPGNVDVLADFLPGTDQILLGGAAGQPFAALGSGLLSQGAFRVGAAAADADDRIIYNSQTGALLYDADGSGSGAAIQFATLSSGLSLGQGSFTISGPANQPTVITSGTTATIAENSPVSTIVYQISTNDPDGDTIAYYLGGSDASFFTIDASGAVRLVNPADYETRQSYSLVLTAADSAGAGTSRSVTIDVTDVADTPTGGGPTPIINETVGFNDLYQQAQVIDRGQLRASDNFNLFNDDLPSATIRGSISSGAPSADIDYFSITLNAGERLILDIDNTVGTLDALVRVYDAAGNQLGFVDDSPVDPGSETDRAGTTLDSFLAFRAPSSGTYYFSVESWGEGSDDGPGTGTTTGSYDLHVSIGPPVSAQEAISEDIQALIGSNGWPDPNPGLPGINLTYAFPNSPSDYPSNTRETQSNFEQFNAVQQAATTTMLQQIAGVANLTFARLFDGQESSATLRFAMSDLPEVAYAYLPGGGLGGTAWFRNSPIGNRSTPSFDNPVPGGYAWMSIVHETGHALGLKHGHEFPAISFERDSTEYTVMTYRSYVGQAPNGYTNETWGFPSTPMMLDIAALQRMYGANFNFNSGDSVYNWHPGGGYVLINGQAGPIPGANRVFMTVWDGGGNDTYDLSNYNTNVSIDLRPGEWTITSQVQLANLGQGHMARGNVGNAYLFNGDTRSLIENGIGGSGNDTLIANQAANRLTGGAGNDTYRWHSVENAGLGAQADIVTDFARGADRIDLAQIDAILGGSNNDSFSFIGTSAFSQVAGQLRYQVEGNSVRIQGDVDGNGVADMEIVLNNVTSLDGSEFFF
jgi:serralysin